MNARTGFVLGAFALTYTLAGHTGLALATVHPQASVVWPATGIGIAGVVLWGPRLVPIVLVGAAVYNYIASGDLASSLAIATGNAAEAYLGGTLVRRLAGGAEAFETGLGALSFCVFAAAIAPIASATVGVATLLLAGHADTSNAASIWLTWYLGNAGGAVTIGSLIITLSRWRSIPPRVAEAVALWLATALVATLVFLAPATRNEIALVALLPLLAWASLRLGPLETSMTLFVIGALSVTGTLLGNGPFAGRATEPGLALLQAFRILVAAVALPIAGLTVAVRRATFDEPRRPASMEPALIGALTFVPLIAATVFVVRLAQDQARAAGDPAFVPWLVLTVGGLASLVITALNVATASTGLRARSIAADMTARLAARERQFRALVDGAPDALLLVDRDGKIRIANQQAARLFGHDENDLVGRRVEDLIPDRYQEAHPALRQGYFDDPRPRPMGLAQLLWARHRDGTEIPVEISLAPIQTDTGTLVAASVRDVTVQRESHRRLTRTRDELERSNRELEEFAYVASHDLQAPLRHVAGYAGLLQETAPSLPEDARHHLERIQAGVRRMQTMIQDLLAYSRAGRSIDERSPVPLGPLVAEIAEPLNAEARALGGHIAWNGLPTVQADRAQLRQVLQNLIENSFNYRGDRPPRIEVSAHDRGDRWEIAVRDEGPGFDPLYKDRVFQMFQRLPESQHIPGTGIGLAICRKVVEAHGGRIWAEPRPGTGCTFRFTLPKTRTAPEDA